MNTKKVHLPKGFLSTNGNPTIHAIVMFFVYLSTLPKDWDESVINQDSVEQVRAWFGVEEGFDVMIMWGIRHECCKSKTSSGRHTAMSVAYTSAKGLIGAGVVMSDIPMMFPMLRKLRKAS